MSEQIRYDVSGNSVMTKILDELICSFPGWATEEPTFSSVGKEKGVGWYPVSDAIITSEKRTITGCVHQECQYPFYVLYRFSGGPENTRIAIKEKLDMLGEWLEKQEISIGAEKYRLDTYPSFAGREIKSIRRTTPSYNANMYENGVSDWVVYITVTYQNDYKE